MHGKNELIDDILSSAKKAASEMISEASEQAEAEIAEIRKRLEAEAEYAASASHEAAESAYAGRVKLGDLEAGKILLAARQNVVASVYDGVKKRILSSSDKEYLALFAKLISECCENGDEVVVSKADSKRMTAAWVAKVGEGCKRKLTLAKEYGDFEGGVILRNKKYDRDLTVDEIVADLKERTIADVVKRLGI